MKSLYINSAFIFLLCTPLFAQQKYPAQQKFFVQQKYIAQQKYFGNKLISGLGVPGVLEIGHPCSLYTRLHYICDSAVSWKADTANGLKFKVNAGGTISMVKCTSSVYTSDYNIRVGKPVSSIYRNYGEPLKRKKNILLYHEIAFEIEKETIAAIIILPSEKLIKKK